MRLPALALAAVLAAGPAQAQDKTFKIAFIDPLSGPFAGHPIGRVKDFATYVTKIKAAGAV